MTDIGQYLKSVKPTLLNFCQVGFLACTALIYACSLQAENTLFDENSRAVSFSSLNTTQNTDVQAVQGGLLLGQVKPGELVWLDSKVVRVASDGSFILGFSRDVVQSELKIQTLDKKTFTQDIVVKARKYKIERVDGLPASKVNPRGEALMKRISEEISLTKKARARDDDRQDYQSGFIWPAKGRISGVYGSQRILNGDPRRPHFGVDIAAPTGANARAPAAGVVTLAHPDMFFSGGTLIIDHGHGLSSSFLHLSEILVEVGQTVSQGEVVAKIGSTGRATGPHLDWRMNWYNVRIDPQLLVNGLEH